MPGLVQASSEQAVQLSLANVGDDRTMGVGQRHTRIVRPDPFHVTVLFQPTLAFLNKATEILPPGMEVVAASGNVLDEFVLKVYLPQLEEKVSFLFQQAVSGACHFWMLFRKVYINFPRQRCIRARSSFVKAVSSTSDQGDSFLPLKSCFYNSIPCAGHDTSRCLDQFLV